MPEQEFESLSFAPRNDCSSTLVSWFQDHLDELKTERLSNPWLNRSSNESFDSLNCVPLQELIKPSQPGCVGIIDTVEPIPQPGCGGIIDTIEEIPSPSCGGIIDVIEPEPEDPEVPCEPEQPEQPEEPEEPEQPEVPEDDCDYSPPKPERPPAPPHNVDAKGNLGADSTYPTPVTVNFVQPGLHKLLGSDDYQLNVQGDESGRISEVYIAAGNSIPPINVTWDDPSKPPKFGVEPDGVPQEMESGKSYYFITDSHYPGSKPGERIRCEAVYNAETGTLTVYSGDFVTVVQKTPDGHYSVTVQKTNLGDKSMASTDPEAQGQEDLALSGMLAEKFGGVSDSGQIDSLTEDNSRFMHPDYQKYVDALDEWSLWQLLH